MPDEQSEEKVETKVEAESGVDYQKELEKATAEVKANEEARQGYALRHKVEKPAEEVTEVSEEEREDRLAQKVVSQLKPIIQQTVESSNFDKKLSELSGGNPALSQLIKLHFDKSVNPNLPLDERLNAAFAIANKNVIAKKVSEITIAQKNRQQIANAGQGGSEETREVPGSNTLTQDQKNDLKKRADILFGKVGNEALKKKFIDDAEKRLAMRN